MHKSWMILPVLALVAACSRENDAANSAQPSDAVATESVSDGASLEASDEAPAISASVAPGVAFDYRYQFALPEAAISDTQARHAALCEKIGIVRCRVTGMNFSREEGGQIAASLAFKLDPALAHGFARDASEIVEQADGRLTDSKVSGVDAGSGIVADDQSLAGIDAELAKIDVQLKIPSLSKQVRGRLVEEAQRLRSERREVESVRSDKVESLATTPVLFDYASSETLLGFDSRSPVNRAARTASASFSTMLEVVLTFAGALAPWALLGGGIWWLVRRLRPKKPVSITE